MKNGPAFPMLPFIIALISVAAMLLWFLDPVRGFGGNKFFQVSLRSSLFADYSVDPRMQAGLAPLDLRIIEEVIQEDQTTANAGEILQQLQTPVVIFIPPTSTPLPNLNIPTSTAAINPTSPQPTKLLTSTVAFTLTSTLTPSPTPSATIPGNSTITVTRTPGRTPTSTPVPQFTNTPTHQPPIVTPTPTKNTVPTGYPPPPTATKVYFTPTPIIATPTVTRVNPTATAIVPSPTSPPYP